MPGRASRPGLHDRQLLSLTIRADIPLALIYRGILQTDHINKN